MTVPWECPVEWQRATVDVEGVRQLVRAEVARALKHSNSAYVDGRGGELDADDHAYLAARFPEAAPEPKGDGGRCRTWNYNEGLRCVLSEGHDSKCRYADPPAPSAPEPMMSKTVAEMCDPTRRFVDEMDSLPGRVMEQDKRNRTPTAPATGEAK